MSVVVASRPVSTSARVWMFRATSILALASLAAWIGYVQGAIPPAWLDALGIVAPASPAASGEVDEHAGHDHSKNGPTRHEEDNSLELSEQARKNIGLTLGKVALGDFERTITIPGIVEEQPGRSTVDVTAPMTGVVTRVFPTQGVAVVAGQPLFELRLTHEELIQGQSDLLRTVEELDVIAQEVKRLEATAGMAIAGKTLLERKYEQQKMQAVLRAQKQTILLHGLSHAEVDTILETRNLLHQFRVNVPDRDGGQALTVAMAADSLTGAAAPAESPVKSPVGSAESPVSPTAAAEPTVSSGAGDGRPRGSGRVYQVQSLAVEQGRHVTAGDRLLTLADHASLVVAADAFEKDIADIDRAVENGWAVSAVVERESGPPEVVRGLRLLHLDNRVDAASRTIHTFVRLPNTLLRDVTGVDGVRYIQWRFKPGQRMQIRVPVERWSDKIVLPSDAVAQDGPESYVFAPNGRNVERRPVHVEFRDPLWVVVANDGAIFAGETICMNAAQQLQLALKNKATGGIDPHAGHNH